jgi:hypothetical protein
MYNEHTTTTPMASPSLEARDGGAISIFPNQHHHYHTPPSLKTRDGGADSFFITANESMTHWCVFFLFFIFNLFQPPTSLRDSLVYFFSFFFNYSTTNESSRLVGVSFSFFSTIQPPMSLHDLLVCFFFFQLINHQQVFTTRWCVLFICFPHAHLPPPPPSPETRDGGGFRLLYWQ